MHAEVTPREYESLLASAGDPGSLSSQGSVLIVRSLELFR